jgi:hypothetical protein
LSPPRVVRGMLKAVTPLTLRPAAFAARHLDRLHRDDRILAGPFRGMHFSWESWDPHFALPLAKFLGTYEMELHSLLERLVRQPFDRMVDVGAAEGFYAVGFALRCPSLQIVAYEQLPKGRALIRQLATANGVADRVDARGQCDIDTLRDALEGASRPLVIMDIEGGEGALLNPAEVPALARSAILVETHDCYAPGVSAAIRERFASTHSTEVIESRSRDVSDARVISSWLRVYARYNVSGWMGERLYPVTWLHLTPLGIG